MTNDAAGRRWMAVWNLASHGVPTKCLYLQGKAYTVTVVTILPRLVRGLLQARRAHAMQTSCL